MARHFRPGSSPEENVRRIFRAFSWKFLILLPLLLLLAVPVFVYAAKAGGNVFPSITQFFYKLSAPQSSETPTPLPPFSSVPPQLGTVSYTIQGGDSCDEILSSRMHFSLAGQVFSDVKPETVKALNNALGQDCHKIQPGLSIPLSPQYPLVALGGVVLKISATNPQQVLPTPLIHVQNQTNYGPDCSGGCLLTVRVNPQVQVSLVVQTSLTIHEGSWVWTQAMLSRKAIPGFDDYPYADPQASVNGMTLRACDFQVDDTHDDHSLACDQLKPNTIYEDGGAWMIGVVGPGALDHWQYPIHLPVGTRVMFWLSLDHNDLKFHEGNAVYQYDDASHFYVKV
jgi:hypothetical protein